MTLNPDLRQSRCAEIEDSHNRLEEIRSVHWDVAWKDLTLNLTLNPKPLRLALASEAP